VNQSIKKPASIAEFARELMNDMTWSERKCGGIKKLLIKDKMY